MSNDAPTDALRLDEPQRKAIEHAAMDANADVWRHCRLAMVADGEIVGYPCFSRADMAELARLYEAAPASPLPGGGWQDISTAPEDGTLVDLFYPERGRLTDAAWGPTGWGRHEWRGSHTVRMVPSEKPTHWMPLPAAPTGEPK